MTWWAWLLLWTVLVAGAAAVLLLLLRRCWRALKALGRETTALGDRLGEASRGVGSWSGPSDFGARIDER